TENNIGTIVCDSRGADISSFDDINSTFFVGLFVSLAEECMYTENQIFENLYFDDFLQWSEPSNTYHYLIAVGPENSKILTLTNSNNNQAIYSSESLNVQNFNKDQFLLYPNPVKNEIHLSSQNDLGTLGIQIFNITGKLLNTVNVDFEKQASVDVSSLSNGIYFLKLTDKNGNIQVKKFIKE